MQVLSSLKTAKTRSRDCQVVRRPWQGLCDL